MRKPTVIIFDDDLINLKVLKSLITATRDYEVLTFDRPVDCPVYGDIESCAGLNPCADIIITDYKMPGMTGIEMLHRQEQRGCGVDMRNKAVMSADLDDKQQEIIKGLGWAFFEKPFKFNNLLAWLDECEKRIDLSVPLGIRRRDNRYAANIDISYSYSTDENVHEGTVMNFSDSGLCLRMHTRLNEGQSFEIKTELPNNCRKGAVRWIKQAEADLYVAGVFCRRD
ncbi:MAG TPA: response regulator [Thermodesulfovibrionales bacterium]|nr:response regulator [Thermodesulfovibrionales bacterium]